MSTLESFNKMLDGFNLLTDERIEEVLNAIDNPLLWVPNDIVIRIPAGDIRAAFNEILLARSSQPAGSSTGEVRYLIWSNEHNAWWRADSAGYSRSILGAGIYSRAEAIDIADKSRNGWSVDQRPDEIAVALADIPAQIRAAVLANAEAQP